MRLLITMKLMDINLKNHIFPLTQIDTIESILIVRDKKGPILDKVEYYCPPEWSLKIPLLNFFIKFFLMMKLSIQKRPDFILGYLFFPHGLLGLCTGKLTGKKVGVSLIAGPVEVYSIGGSPIGRFAYTRPLPSVSVMNKLILFLIKKFDVIIVGGAFSQQFLKKNGVTKEKIFILLKSMDKVYRQFHRHKEFDIIYIGRLAEVKHVDTIVRATSHLIKTNPLIKIGIVGDGPERLNLEHLTSQFGLSSNIHFVGWQKDPWNWFNKAKISVLSSEREGFAQSVVQSMQCGVPVITTACGDVCDVVLNGYNGVVFGDYLDDDALAGEIEKLLGNPQLLNKYTNNALKTVEDFFTVQSVISVWTHIFNHISCGKEHSFEEET
jgi:glycosyltransferase involved in cell wall biosynthesis